MGIPIIITSRDRLSSLKELLTYLPLEDVTIVDNDSTYEPLLEFYEDAPCKVTRLDGNYGHHAPWKSGAVPRGTPYIITDPDLIPQQGCPEDFIQFIQEVLAVNPDLLKVGLGLDITDLPDHYAPKPNVLTWEEQFWPSPASIHRGVPLYHVSLDTTFAIYKANSDPGLAPSFRTGHPYVMKHLSWYINSANPTEEDIYYRQHANLGISSWLYDDTERYKKRW